MAWKRFSQQSVNAPNTVVEWRLGGPQDVNFFEFFWHFPNPYIKWDQKSLGEQGKVENSVKWVTLMASLWTRPGAIKGNPSVSPDISSEDSF